MPLETEKRSRSGNFAKMEIKLLLKLANSKKGVLENKTNSGTNKLKAGTWDQLEKNFNSQTQGPPRSSQVLRAKYEAIKRALRKKSQDLKKTGGRPREKSPSPLLEEEKELRDTIILSCEGLAPLPQDSDYNPEVPKGKSNE